MTSPLIGLTTTQISEACVLQGYPAFRGKQIATWIYGRNVLDSRLMTNLPANIRTWLTPEVIGGLEVVGQTESPDGTIKYLLKLADGETIECVLLPYKDRVSLCISSQVGCPLGCVFCATGASGYTRNLTVNEIIGQYIAASNLTKDRISHVVFMGMGEPLLNVDNVLAALGTLEDEIGLSARHVTLSTIGIPTQIRRLAKSKLQSTLAISLHAADQKLRATLMPATAKYPMWELMAACRAYFEMTHRRLTFEYLMIDGINDIPAHARKLSELLRGLLCHVNLIPYNPIPGCEFRRSSNEAISLFKAHLEAGGISVTQRFERGASKDSACGQLRRNSESASK